PYPAGTGRTTHNFSVAHMFTVAMRGHLPGQTETPPVTKTANGIQVTFTGLSPVLVAWTEISNQSNPTNPSNPSNPAQPSNPGSGSAPSPQATGSEGQNATGGTDTVATRTNAQGARSASGAQNTNARGGQTGDDMYERLGLHTLVLLAALLLLIAQLRKLMDENKLLAIAGTEINRKKKISGLRNQKLKTQTKCTESGLEFIDLDAETKR
ncbi:MAG: hypothetical protein IJQ21_09310, partial [Lachnospiraceae bacterium]|nr:hypothetical protein [Lachnospiraceae bacterium]